MHLINKTFFKQWCITFKTKCYFFKQKNKKQNPVLILIWQWRKGKIPKTENLTFKPEEEEKRLRNKNKINKNKILCPLSEKK